MGVIAFPNKWTDPSCAESQAAWRSLLSLGLRCNMRVPTDADVYSTPDGQTAMFLLDLVSDNVPVQALPPEVADQVARGIEGIQLGTDVQRLPCLNVYSIGVNGLTSLLRVVGSFPYFYAKLTSDRPDLSKILTDLETVAKSVSHPNSRAVLDIIKVTGKSILHYGGPNAESAFVKICLSSQMVVARVREGIKRGEVQGLDTVTYESNIPFELRSLVDTGLSSGAWFFVPSTTLQRPKTEDMDENVIPGMFKGPGKQRVGLFDCPFTFASVDLAGWVHVKGITAADSSSEPCWSKIPTQLRTFSFDIECVTLGRKGFPKAELDPVIQIACSTETFGGEHVGSIVLCLHETAALTNATVVWFNNESDLLLAFCEYLRALDPDIVSGYNCFNFDMNYLFSRAVALGVQENFGYLSRWRSYKSVIKDERMSSGALGIKMYKTIEMRGRVGIDVLEAVRREYKLKSYTLNHVSAHFLSQQKEDVHYSMMSDLWQGGPDTRKRIASYCLKDAILPLKLLSKLLITVNMIEMARVTGVPISYLLTRGQQIKVTSQILRECLGKNVFMPAVARGGGEGDKFEGATVLEPKKGFYRQPITTLDFASLYPSIMIAHNLCYSSLVPEPSPQRLAMWGLTQDDVTVTPAGHTFVVKHVQQGVLPTIVNNLIMARKATRKQMANTSDPLTKLCLNGRQLALKISANSVYGYTGAAAGGQLPCLEISTSITAYGREMIEITRKVVQEEYTVNKGKLGDANVVYGDTDSVMVDFSTGSLEKAMEYGTEAAALITKHFKPPICLEFEKVFCPFLLMNKKRYAGLLYTRPGKWEKMDCKGIETVRRDFCALVQQTVDATLRLILIDQDVEGAKNYIKGVIERLKQNKIDMSLLVLNKSIGKEEYNVKMGHVELAKRMRLRDPGSAPAVGDRVHFVIVAKGKNVPQYEKAEDPLYVLENNITIDYQYYLDSLKNPVVRILEPCMRGERPEALFEGGDHTLKSHTMVNRRAGLGKFMTEAKESDLRCLSCKVTLKNVKRSSSGVQLCEKCERDQGPQLVQRKYAEVSHLRKTYNCLWTECQRCQESLVNDVICTSKDCAIFYKRTKVRNELNVGEEQLRALYEAE